MPSPRPYPHPAVISPHAPDRWAGADDRDAVVRWQALLDARLIGSASPPDPAHIAAIEHAEALLCPAATGWRRASLRQSAGAR